MAGVRQFNESEMLEKALALFWQKGFADTSMPELAAATGVQRGSLYNAYGGKEALFLRAFNVHRERFLPQIRLVLEHPDLRIALHGFFDLVITSMMTGAPTRGCLTTKSAFGGGEALEAPVRDALSGMLDGFEAALVERLMLAEGAPRLRLPPRQAAQLIVTFTRGIVVIERVYQDEARLRVMADALVGLLLDDAR